MPLTLHHQMIILTSALQAALPHSTQCAACVAGYRPLAPSNKLPTHEANMPRSQPCAGPAASLHKLFHLL